MVSILKGAVSLLAVAQGAIQVMRTWDVSSVDYRIDSTTTELLVATVVLLWAATRTQK